MKTLKNGEVMIVMALMLIGMVILYWVYFLGQSS